MHISNQDKAFEYERNYIALEMLHKVWSHYIQMLMKWEFNYF